MVLHQRAMLQRCDVEAFGLEHEIKEWQDIRLHDECIVPKQRQILLRGGLYVYSLGYVKMEGTKQ